MKASIVLTASASKRLIARGVAAHPIVEKARTEGTIIVTLGTTNGYVAQELAEGAVDQAAFAAGVIDHRWNVNERLGEATDLVLKCGEVESFDETAVINGLGAGDVIIKGGNALDPFGTAGVLLAAATGGTIGRYIPAAMARGVDIVIPISVSKSVHVPMATLALDMGSRKLDLAMGLPCGVYPLTGNVVTEIEALELLFDVNALHVASNGIGAGCGSVSLLVSGEESNVRDAFVACETLNALPEIQVQGRQ